MFLFLFLYTVYGLVKKKKEMANKDFETIIKTYTTFNFCSISPKNLCTQRGRYRVAQGLHLHPLAYKNSFSILNLRVSLIYEN